MKILYLHQYFNTNNMPGSTRSFELSKRLVKNGHEVFVITSKRDNYQSKKNKWTSEDGINVYWIPVYYSNNMTYLRRMFSFLIFSLKSTLKSLTINADLVYATSTPLTIGIPGIIYSKLKSKPMIFEVRDLWPDIPIAIGALKFPLLRYLAIKFENFIYRQSSSIIALSDGMKDGIIKKGNHRNKIKVITNFSYVEAYKKKEEINN